MAQTSTARSRRVVVVSNDTHIGPSSAVQGRADRRSLGVDRVADRFGLAGHRAAFALVGERRTSGLPCTDRLV
jgi:hypothetical protein